MSEYFPKPKSSGENVKVRWDLPNYAAKNNSADSLTSDFPKKE